MSYEAWAVKSTEPESVETVVKLTGTGNADPTKTLGRGVVATHTGTGAYKLVWAESPGVHETDGFSFAATTMADLAGYTVVFKPYVTSTKTLEFTVYNSTFAAADLQAAQFIRLVIKFKRTASGI